MNLLLDTHVLLWWLDDNPALGAAARTAICDPENAVFVSAIVVWEIRIKQALGKLEIPEDFRSALEAQPFSPLPVTAEHAHGVATLPDVHRDPFDRMLVSQAVCEGLTLVTHDQRLAAYPISVLDA